MLHILWIILLALLAASWALFIRYYRSISRSQTQTAKKFDDTRRQVAEQVANLGVFVDLLAEIHEFVSGNTGPESQNALFKMVLNAACQIAKCPAGSLMLADKEGTELVMVASKGLPELAKSTRLKMGEGVAGRAAESRKAVIVDNIETDARFINRKDVESHLKSLVSIPLKIKSRVVGVLNVDSPEAHRPFSERDIQLLSVLASLASMGIENLELYNNLQVFYVEMIETLADSLDFKEGTDRSKSRAYARLIAEELKLPDSIVRYVEFASLMHGIGKIGIAETILCKPGKLTPDEYEQIKKHPEIAQQMIAKVKFLSPVVPMILYHQERWDGSGYPAGLKGEEIPLGSRIVAVINAFQAMISERPYRKALEKEDVLQEIKRGAGSQFDPKVVEAFVKILESGS